MLDWLRQRTQGGAAKAPPASTWVQKGTDAEPTEVGAYRIVKKIGEGGMGRVFLCEKVDQPGSKFALKQLMEDDADLLDRFKREIVIGQKVRHPNVCGVTDWGMTAQGRAYLVMEFLTGESLQDAIARQAPMPLENARAYLEQILTGLEAVHKAGIIHRDLNPNNIFVTADGSLKLLDFGLATGDGPSVTATGIALGTMTFMPPEQLGDAKYVTPAADVYNVGFMAYLMLTGHLPIESSDFITAIMCGEYTPITKYRTDLPPAFLSWLDRMMKNEASDRFPTAAEARAALPS